MKKKMNKFIIAVLFLAGLSLVLYPTVANQWNTYRQRKLIGNYESTMKEMNPKDFKAEWKKAESFNTEISQNNLYGNVFGEENTDLKDTEYWKVLNIAEDGVMGYLTIPKINVKLAIYHGTANDVLQTGIGHLSGTKLPIGGESTHSVLAAHRGLPSARLFTDIDQMEVGDKFYIHVLDEVLAKALTIEEGKDQVTLFTCTPYGVNSHRLLVRGTRVPYNGEEDGEVSVSKSMVESIQNYYMLYLILGLAVTILIILFMRFLSKKKENMKKE